MNKKSLDESLEADNYNKNLFDKSMSMISNCKKIPISSISSSSASNAAVKEKYVELENKFVNIFKLLGKFVQAEKPVYGNCIDFGLQILEESKVLIDTKIRKNQEQKNTVKKPKHSNAHTNLRPQQEYQNIGPYHNFQKHPHQTYLNDGIIPQIHPSLQHLAPTIQNLNQISEEPFYVDTPAKLDQAIQELTTAQEIAVDVEHSNKSYQGMTCLIQISSRKKDYLIDVFPIWTHVPKLSQVIGNPKILKVMHGADMDTKWLQRDFNLHIINLFDTHRASRVLGMAKFSYAFLLQHYCKTNTDKSYQRADWRKRPLSPQMLLYARMDTHYLLPIYDRMRIDLQKQSKTVNLNIQSVFWDIQKSSHEVTLNQAELFDYRDRQMYQNLKEQFKRKNSNYFKAIQQLFEAINYVARTHDENFDDIITKKSLIDAIAFIKDLIYNKKSKATKKARIDRVLVSLKNNDGVYTGQILQIVRPALQSVFVADSNRTMEDEDLVDKIKPSKDASAKIEKVTRKKVVEQQEKQQMEQKFKRMKISTITLQQYIPNHILGHPIKKHRPQAPFTNFLNFVSQKYNISQHHHEDSNEDLAYPNSEIEEQEISNQQEKHNEAALEEQEGVIEFKRMNPNVMYVIEEDDKSKQKQIDEAVKKSQPRKKKRQTEYEARIRNKEGNIYDLLS